MNPTAWITPPSPAPARIFPRMQPAASRSRYNNPSDSLAALAETFAPISLAEMDAVALLDRTDTKFMVCNFQLLQALAAVQSDYQMLCIAGQRLNHYRTLYFDTPDFELYRLHVNGRADRYKVRSREYTDSDLSFLEVKHKTSKDRTIKERMRTARPVVQMTQEAENWLEGVLPYDSRALEPKLWNTFTRITLVSQQHCERVTLDVNLGFYTAGKTMNLEGVAVVEVKTCSGNQPSAFLAQMHAQRIHPQGFSKYCLGVSLLYENVKKNALKPKLLRIEKMTGGVYDHE